MKKIAVLLAFLCVGLIFNTHLVKAQVTNSVPDNVYFFGDGKGYNVDGTQEYFCFQDGSCYSVQGVFAFVRQAQSTIADLQNKVGDLQNQVNQIQATSTVQSPITPITPQATSTPTSTPVFIPTIDDLKTYFFCTGLNNQFDYGSVGIFIDCSNSYGVNNITYDFTITNLDSNPVTVSILETPSLLSTTIPVGQSFTVTMKSDDLLQEKDLVTTGLIKYHITNVQFMYNGQQYTSIAYGN